MLEEELKKLELTQLKYILEVWEVPNTSENKRTLISWIIKTLEDPYYIRGILEKLTPLQVEILVILIQHRDIPTLGEISRKLKIPSINIEQELAVLKHFLLVLHKKNRERLTSNLDKYYLVESLKEHVPLDRNKEEEYFTFSIRREILSTRLENLSKNYRKFFKKSKTTQEVVKTALNPETFSKILDSLTLKEQRLVDEVFIHGGALDIHSVRGILDEEKISIEITLRTLDQLFVLKDVCFIDERYVRFLIIPIELFKYLKEKPLFLKSDKIEERKSRVSNNHLDFIINLKRVLLFILNKGLTLSQAERIKLVDLKKCEEFLLPLDISVVPEKSKIYLLSIIIPILKLFNLVDIRDNYIVLEDIKKDFLKEEPLRILSHLLDKLQLVTKKPLTTVHEVFTPAEVPFCNREVMKTVVDILKQQGEVYVKVILADLIRNWVLLNTSFKMKDLKQTYLERRLNIISVLFYMHVLGLVNVEYPKRLITLSGLGKYYYLQEEVNRENQKGCILVNPDLSIVGYPEKLSILGVYFLKLYTRVESFDQVYTFKITKESLQEAVVLGYSIEEFIKFLTTYPANPISKNILNSIENWSTNLPIVYIEENLVLLEIATSSMTDELLAQLKNEEVVYKVLSSQALILYKSKVPRVIEVAEKLEMIIQLIR